MKNVKYYMAATLIAVAALMAAYQHGTLHAEAGAAPAKIAVVNVTKVITNCRKFKDWQAQKQKEIQQIESELSTMQNELKSLQEDLQILAPGSVDFQKREKEFIEKRAAYQAKDTVYKDLWDRQKEQWTEKLYQQLLTVIDEVAAKKGLDIVLANEDLNLTDPMRPDIMQTIVTKKILYRNSKHDITDQVLAALDARD